MDCLVVPALSSILKKRGRHRYTTAAAAGYSRLGGGRHRNSSSSSSVSPAELQNYDEEKEVLIYPGQAAHDHKQLQISNSARCISSHDYEFHHDFHPNHPNYLNKYPDDDDDVITVVVGKEMREFKVDPIVLQASPFRVLIQMLSYNSNSKEESTGTDDGDNVSRSRSRSRRRRHRHHNNCRKIFVDVESILFEHMLWLFKNDCPTLFKLNIQEILDFYAQEN